VEAESKKLRLSRHLRSKVIAADLFSSITDERPAVMYSNLKKEFRGYAKKTFFRRLKVSFFCHFCHCTIQGPLIVFKNADQQRPKKFRGQFVLAYPRNYFELLDFTRSGNNSLFLNLQIAFVISDLSVLLVAQDRETK
jgi:hypothetical protein